MVKDNTILGYIPYQCAKQVAIISAISAAILFVCNGPEKYSIAAFSIVTAAVSMGLKWKFEVEKEQILKIHSRLIRS